LTESQPQFRLNKLSKVGEYRNDPCLAFRSGSGFGDVQYDGHAQARLELVSRYRQDQTLIVSLEMEFHQGCPFPGQPFFRKKLSVMNLTHR
jgi:hypothetical protein